jgi:GSH-dependent disulfide-bond oxidoreductase
LIQRPRGGFIMESSMIDLYTWSTPNGRKVSIMLEELALPYEVHAIDITKDEQFDAAFLRISPNNKIPAIVDQDTGLTLMESGAILLYLARRTGRFLPANDAAYWRTIEWLMWQMGGAGPMLGQAHHFVHFNPGKSDYAEQRYGNEAKRLYGVLDRRLGENAYLAGGEYTVADMATWPWIARFEWQGVDFSAYPNALRWYREIAERPAVKRGFIVPNPADIPMP